MEKSIILYIHGKGGNATEAEHYRSLLPQYEVIGLDYKSDTPWEFSREVLPYADSLVREHGKIIIIASSIGAYFAMNSLSERQVDRAFFISPVADMNRLITDMMKWADVSEKLLREKGTIDTDFGETLSWEYYNYAKNHPVKWNVPTEILYGECDNLISYETVSDFADKHSAGLTVLKGGEHWFHTDGQMKFLDDWIFGKL